MEKSPICKKIIRVIFQSGYDLNHGSNPHDQKEESSKIADDSTIHFNTCERITFTNLVAH